MNGLRTENINPGLLILDPNNFRFHDKENYVTAVEHRYHEAKVQEKAFLRLRDDESLATLKKSILTNGYLPVERVVVRPYMDGLAGQYVVIEGNRRVAAIRWIHEDYNAGVEISPEVLKSIEEIPCIIVEGEADDEVFKASLMGIRHVSGIQEWGGYQRAKLVARLRDDLQVSAQETAERLGMSVNEVNRRFRAFKSLQQMKETEEFSEYARPELYGLFHEAVSIPLVREWLGWDEATSIFTNGETLAQFYQLICPTHDEDDQELPPKITGYATVRELKNILPHPDAKRVLLDPQKSLQEALAVALKDEYARAWATEISTSIQALEGMGVSELKNLSIEDIALLQKMSDKCLERIEDHKQLMR